MLGRRAGLISAGAGVPIALFGVAAALLVTPDPGVYLGEAGAVVLEVLPGSPVWRDGIRPGQPVLEFHDSFEQAGWELMVQDGEAVRASGGVGHVAALRAATPLSALGLAAVLLGLLLLARHEPIGLAVAMAGVGAAAIPLSLTGSLRDLSVEGLLVPLLATLAVGVSASGRRWVLVVLAMSLYALAWIWSSFVDPRAFDAIEITKDVFVVGLIAIVAWLTVDRKRLTQTLSAPGGPGPFGVLYLPLIVSTLLVAMAFAGLALWLAVVLLVLAVIAYPVSRRAAGRSFERILMGRVRRQAEMRAVEDERERLAREIHDSPLQNLSAVIRRLDAKPSAQLEAEELRQIADQLRHVAIELHPPVLEDLGLAAALEDLADDLRVREPIWSISVEADELDGARPDREQELAAFRIASEACSNALAHSGGDALRVVATVTKDTIDLVIKDNGTGFRDGAVAAARREGHFGLEAMRDRAEAVAGRVVVETGPTGTRVHYSWERAL